MAHPRSLLDRRDVSKIKKRLWAGFESQDTIADFFNMSQPTISRIYRGIDHSDVPWPDGSVGGITKQRRMIIHKRRKDPHEEEAPSRDPDVELVMGLHQEAEEKALKESITRKGTNK